MNVQPTSSLLFSPAPARSSSGRQYSTASPTNAADTVSICRAALDLYAAASTQSSLPRASSGSDAKAEFDTTKGTTELDIESYFAPQANQHVTLDSVPLLLPSQKNINALSDYISAHMPGFLADNGIPAPPANITYDTAGQIQLPADYPYSAEFKQALENNPVMERTLHTTYALTSHMVEMNKSIPFQREYAAATSQAQIDAVIAKYQYLFSTNRHYDKIALNFTANGILSITHDSKPLSEA
ncbi:MAG: hypothetical protein P8011_10925 [Acidihalobacter sp.]|uniref:hypothetical protein n=1 Tax=Acidihalobacter sp. TaxID=1872108 RepID=UPI00307EAFE4